MPRQTSKVLSKVTNPVISIEPCRYNSNYSDNNNASQPFITKTKPRSQQSDWHLKKKRKARVTRPSRSPIYVQCFNPIVSIPPMTKEVQSNINIYPKFRPRPKTVYEYKYPYSSSEENEEFNRFLPSSDGMDCRDNVAYFKIEPTLHGDSNIASSSLSKQQGSKFNFSLKNQIDLIKCQGFAKEHDCDGDDIESLVTTDRPSQRHGPDNKLISSSLEADFMLNKFSSRLEERLGSFLKSITFGQSSTTKEEPNCAETPICELLQTSEITHKKESFSNIEEQTKFTQPTKILPINEFTNTKDELSCTSSLDIKAVIKYSNKCSQTEPFLRDNYLNRKEISINDPIDQNIEKDYMPSPQKILVEHGNNHSCNKTESIVVESSIDSTFSAKSKQIENINYSKICMNETFDVDQPNKKLSTANYFVDYYSSLCEAKSELPIEDTTSQQNLDDATELPLFFNQNNTYLTHAVISTQELDCISKVNSVGSASPKQAASNAIEITTNKNNLHKLSESFESIKIEGYDEDKHTGITNDSSRSTIGSLMDQIPPKDCEMIDKINSCYSEKMESDVHDIEASIDHKIVSIDRAEDLFTFPSSSEIECFKVPESNHEVSSGEILQSPFEFRDLTISEGELGFEASFTSDMWSIEHIAINVSPKDTSLFESLPSFALDNYSNKSIQVSKGTQTEFPISNQHLKDRRTDFSEFSWTKDVDDTVSSGELIMDTDKTLCYATTPEIEDLLKENLKLRNKVSCYSGRFCLGFVRDPG